MRQGRGTHERGRGLAAIVAGLLLFPGMALAQNSQLESGLADLRDERAQAEAELEELSGREDDALARLAAVDDLLDAAEARQATLTAELEVAREAHDRASAAADVARARLAEVQEVLEATVAELDGTQAQLDARVRAAFMYGQISFTEAFVGVRDVSDFINSGTYIAHVLDHDQTLVLDVQRLLGEVQARRAEAQVLRSEAELEARAAAGAADRVEAAVDEQQRITEEIRLQRAERERIFEELREDRRAIQGHLAGLEAESRRIQDQLAEIARQQAEQRRLEAERRAQAGQAPAARGDGSWQRPVPGRVTSPFGPRWGRNHNGIDLAGSVGTPVVASRGGLVVQGASACHPTNSWACGGGFGNYLTIAHDDGMASIYAHLSSVNVGIGQRVAAGATIGAVGNSGNSYGPHLHFETREAGVPRNPCNYVGC